MADDAVKLYNVDEIDDMNIDDIDDLPSFGNWPSGAYIVRVDEDMERTVNEDGSVFDKVKFTLVEIGQMTGKLDEDESEPKAGDIQDISFMVSNDNGVKALKGFLMPIGKKLGLQTVREIKAALQGLTLVITQKRTYNKKKERNFVQLTTITVAS